MRWRKDARKEGYMHHTNYKRGIILEERVMLGRVVVEGPKEKKKTRRHD
jgi:hypothetical protein